MSETTTRAALVSGAGSGAGRAIALALAGLGLDVTALGREASKLDETAALARDRGQAVHPHPCDVADRSAVEATVKAVLARAGCIDVLVCNAGINVTDRSLEKLAPADWDRMLATNLTGAFNLVHFTLPAMRAQRSGLVVQICSIAGKRSSVLGGAGYSASKFGQAALGVCLGREERLHGIRSSVIYPGEINTPILDRRPVPVPPERRAAILQPEDVAAAVRFLVDLPPRASVPEMVLMPAVDDWC
jgi:NADP-dependent 3-hydroxy acid dehydrogenase YdfG